MTHIVRRVSKVAVNEILVRNVVLADDVRQRFDELALILPKNNSTIKRNSGRLFTASPNYRK